MKPLMMIGLLLVVLGVAALGYQGVTWITTRDTVAKVGPVEVQADRAHAVPLVPIIGGVAVAAGAVMIVVGASRKAT